MFEPEKLTIQSRNQKERLGKDRDSPLKRERDEE